jgi:hypothetical protein
MQPFNINLITQYHQYTDYSYSSLNFNFTRYSLGDPRSFLADFGHNFIDMHSVIIQ